MRNAINQNRTVQLALLGLLALAGGLMLMKSKGGGETSAATTTDTGAATAPADAAAAAAAAAGVPTTAVPVSTPAPTAATPIPTNLIPGPGLPKGLLPAYRNGKSIVLLVRRAGGRDDALVRSSVESLGDISGIKLYVTKAMNISRFSWLTQGVEVSELPALIVLRPRKLTDGTPTATVSYGFRTSDSAAQAVKDALYRGPTDRPYHP